MFRRKRRSRSSRLRAPAAHAVEAPVPSIVEGLEGRVLLSTFMVANLNDSGAGSLRNDIVMSNTAGGSNTITFAPGLSGTITLTSGQLEISNDLTITGPGAGSLTISGNNKSRVFQIDANVTAAISSLTIAGGHAADGVQGTPGHYDAKGNYIDGGPGGAGADGGGIYSLGTLTLSDDTIINNTAGTGGAGGAGVQIFSSVTTGGAGGLGGRGGAIYSTGSLSIMACTISLNDAGAGGPGGPWKGGGDAGAGGAVYSTGFLSISSSTLTKNSSGNGGGGGILRRSGRCWGSGGRRVHPRPAYDRRFHNRRKQCGVGRGAK